MTQEDRLEQLVDTWEDQRTIKNLMGKYANIVLLNREGEIMDLFWSTKEDVCLGLNDGYYVGRDAVKGYYKAVEDRNMLVAKTLQEIFPQQLGALTDEELYGIGPFKVEPLYNPVIEIAGDRQSAKGLWSCQGAHNEVGSAGPVANWTWGYFAVDFVREDDTWKIYHLLYVNDVDSECGKSWGRNFEPYPDREEFAEIAAFSYPAFTVEKENRAYYTPDRPITLTPRIPEAYQTFSETFSYGI